ncbi:MAG: hypothetical protein WCG01_02785 [bacterium]
MRLQLVKIKSIKAVLFFCWLLIIGMSSYSLVLASSMGVGAGIQTSVPENEYSRAAIQLRQKSTELDQRQQALDNLQKKIEQGNQTRDKVLVVAGLSLFVLIVINYYLDLHRRKLTGIKT